MFVFEIPFEVLEQQLRLKLFDLMLTLEEQDVN